MVVDRQKDRQTDRQTDKVSYRGASPLKKHNKQKTAKLQIGKKVSQQHYTNIIL